MKGYIVKFGEIAYRFNKEEDARAFYEKNKQDYMDAPEEVEIDETDETALMSWYDNGCWNTELDFPTKR